jgi:hypothetical protein
MQNHTPALTRYIVSEIYEYELEAPDPETARELFEQFMQENEDSEATGCRFMDNALEIAELTDGGQISESARAVLLELADVLPEVKSTDTWAAHFGGN